MIPKYNVVTRRKVESGADEPLNSVPEPQHVAGLTSPLRSTGQRRKTQLRIKQ